MFGVEVVLACRDQRSGVSCLVAGIRGRGSAGRWGQWSVVRSQRSEVRNSEILSKNLGPEPWAL